MRSPQLPTTREALSPPAPQLLGSGLLNRRRLDAVVESVRPWHFSGSSWCGGTVLCRWYPLLWKGRSCPWWSSRGAGACCGFFPVAVTKPGWGGARAAGVQGSLSSCNIPHLKYEAKFLLSLHKERGVNCVLPISSSRVLQSLCLHLLSSFGQTFPNAPPFLPALDSRSAARRAMAMGCLPLEDRTRALLGMVRPRAQWFSPRSWSSSGFVAEVAGCGLGTVLSTLSLSQPR